MTEEISGVIFGVWFLIGAALVFWMQAGFAMVEAGFTRAKNTGNILMKNLMDFCIGTVVFILTTRSCKFNILHEPCRPDKRSASGSFAFASTFNSGLKPGIKITLLSFAVARPFRLVYGAYQYFWYRDGVFSLAASLSL